jgi:hypothetical protein
MDSQVVRRVSAMLAGTLPPEFGQEQLREDARRLWSHPESRELASHAVAYVEILKHRRRRRETKPEERFHDDLTRLLRDFGINDVGKAA